MAKNKEMPQNTNKLYINVNNFLQAKNQLKGMKKDCTDRKLSQLLDCDIRTMQKYHAEKNQFPIPRLRLEKLAQYMDVSPEWLCGFDTFSFPGVGYSEIKALENALNKYDQREILTQYIHAAGIKSSMSNYPVDIKDNGPFTEISGVSVTYEQFNKYLDEIEAAIEYITSRYILNLEK